MQSRNWTSAPSLLCGQPGVSAVQRCWQGVRQEGDRPREPTRCSLYVCPPAQEDMLSRPSGYSIHRVQAQQHHSFAREVHNREHRVQTLAEGKMKVRFYRWKRWSLPCFYGRGMDSRATGDAGPVSKELWQSQLQSRRYDGTLTQYPRRISLRLQ